MIEYSLDKINSIKANVASPVFTGSLQLLNGVFGVEFGTATNYAYMDFHGSSTFNDYDARIGCDNNKNLGITASNIAFSCTPTAPTAPSGSNSTQLATTAFVMRERGGRRNYLVNGNFDKWDYGTSQDPSGYGSDNRWLNGNSGTTKTHSQQTCGDTERALFNAMYYSRSKVTTSSGSSNYASKTQYIENVNLLANKTVTISFWAKADAAKNIAIEFTQFFGTGGSPSSEVTAIGSQLVALTTSWQKKVITVALPSISGKTLGSDGVQTTCTKFVFWFDAGSNYNTRAANLGQQSGTFDIAQVKIEDGIGVTNGWYPYDGEFGGEIAACQRYLNKFTNLKGDFGAYAQGAYATCYVNYTPMRVVPNITSSLANVSYGNAEKLKMDWATINTARILWDATAATTDAWFSMGSGDYFMLSAEMS
jgi:hypothetical protein